MNNPDHISGSLETIFWVKIIKFFDADPGSEKFGSGINNLSELCLFNKPVSFFCKRKVSKTSFVNHFVVCVKLYGFSRRRELKMFRKENGS
jgi:hypothetical protein